jgi:polysaccharide biosynthesis transport protein
VMVASSIPREGKSMVATNLAAAFANLGEKTLLIDADLRRGKIHRGFNTSASPGLSNVLQGSVALTDAVIATGVPNLYALTRGKGVKHVPELLLSDAFADLMKTARGEYERIVVDTPPVLGLSETCGMLPLVDGVLMVVWCGYTPLDQLKTATELLASNGATFYGCILNRLDLSAATHYQHYYYYSNYYYQSYRPDEVSQEAGRTSA